MRGKPGIVFIITGLIFLLLGLFVGLLGGVQYISESFISDILPFYKVRPLHVFLVTSFIILTATGGVYYYLNEIFELKPVARRISKIHFILFAGTAMVIVISFVAGYFGGREYLEYPPLLALPIVCCWVIMGVAYLRTVKNIRLKDVPIYYWMWGTGILFFLITYLESYLWMFPYFRDNIVRDVTVQWKSLGSMVGAWNMLIYGAAFYIMEKISGNEKTARAPLTFFFYFLGLTNLMFNWGHHTYIVPSAPWIKYTAYIISMTELLILGNIIWGWRKTVTEAQKNFHNMTYRLLSASDLWIFLNLVLAITISVPAINQYTHGTHITVAHAMGATIGINTMILLASVNYIVTKYNSSALVKHKRVMSAGFWITNVSLIIFWVSLLTAGYIKGRLIVPGSNANFREIMITIQPYLESFAVAGFGVSIGLVMLVYPLLKPLLSKPATSGSDQAINSSVSTPHT